MKFVKKKQTIDREINFLPFNVKYHTFFPKVFQYTGYNPLLKKEFGIWYPVLIKFGGVVFLLLLRSS